MPCAEPTTNASAKSSFANVVGLAASTTGQSSRPPSEIRAVSPAGSLAGQCGFAAESARCAGARHVASHHARIGAAVATTDAVSSTTSRINTITSIAVDPGVQHDELG
jgi:hypothetical protein